MQKLIKRLEALETPNEAIMREIFWAIVPNSADSRRFEELLAVEAWEQAAMTLVPERFRDSWSLNGGNGWEAEVGFELANANTPAIALCIAILRTQEEK